MKFFPSSNSGTKTSKPSIQYATVHETSFAAYVLKSILNAAAVMIGASLLISLLVVLAPGPDTGLKGEPGISSGGLIFYKSWLFDLFQGKLGLTREGLPITAVVWNGLKITLMLCIGSLALSLFIAIPSAIIVSFKEHSMLSPLLTLFFYLLSAAPVFILGYFTFLGSVHYFNKVPLPHAFSEAGSFGKLLVFCIPFVILTIGDGNLTGFFRHIRDELKDLKTEDHIRGALSRGVPLFGHFFKGSVISVLLLINNKFAWFMGGAVVLECIFNLKGLGYLSWKAAETRDYRLIMIITLIAVAVVSLVHVINLIIMLRVDPRLRSSSKSADAP